MADLREALDSAFETVAADVEPTSVPEPAPAPEPVQETPPSPSETEQARSERARDEAGRFAKKAAEDAAAAPKVDEKPAAPPVPGDKTPAPEKPAAQPPAASKAPQSWKPVAREEWSKISPTVQAEVVRREREVQQALQESSEARQAHQRFKEAVAPFEQMIRAEGAEPMQAIQGLLQTAYALRFAPPQTRADMIAKMVSAYLPGREGLEMLDRRLAGEPAQQGPQQPQPQQIRDPRVDKLLETLQQRQQVEVQTQQQRAAEMVEEIKQQEFYEDVRLDMADILEVAQRRGLQMTVKQAYDRACALNPEISRVLTQREEAKRLATPAGATLAARRAGSSPRPSPAIPPKGDRPAGDLRSDLEASVDALVGGSRA